MKNAGLITVLLSLVLFHGAAGAGEMDMQTRERLSAIDSAVDELKNPLRDASPERRASRGESLNHAFVALTGEAANPLFGVAALGVYNYFTTPEALRDSLPIYDQPVIWVPLLVIILLMLFNSTLCEAMPFLKIPLNALGDIVNKAGAVAVLPLVVKMFADAFAMPAASQLASAADALFPVAYAGETGVMGAAWLSMGWLAGAAIGFVIYMAVWLTFNVVDVLILLCPFPGIDALLKSMRLAVIGALAGLHQVSPSAAGLMAGLIVLISLFLAGWSFRLSVFGLLYSSDILFLRRRDAATGNLPAFSCAGLRARANVPVRTLGRLEADADGLLSFSYRPWLVLPRRRTPVGKPEHFACGRGLFNPFLVPDNEPDNAWLRLPPRYRGQEEPVATRFHLRRVVNCGVSGALRSWLSANFGSGKARSAKA